MKISNWFRNLFKSKSPMAIHSFGGQFVMLHDFPLQTNSRIENDFEVRYMLLCIMEECAEIAKEASKCLRFGPHDSYETVTPLQRLNNEINDLRVIIQILKEYGVELPENQHQQSDKRSRLMKYMGYSKQKLK